MEEKTSLFLVDDTLLVVEDNVDCAWLLGSLPGIGKRTTANAY